MAIRKTKNVSLTPEQDRFVDTMVESGRYRTSSEVLRDGLRLLEENEHRRLLERAIYGTATPEEAALLPPDLQQRARAYFDKLIREATADVTAGRTVDGPTAVQALRKELGNGPG